MVVPKNNRAVERSTTEVFTRALSNPKLVLVFVGNTLVIPAFDMTAILPTLLSEHLKGLSTELIGTIASLFPLISVPTVLFGAWLEPKLNDANRWLFYCSLQLVSTVSLYMLSARNLYFVQFDTKLHVYPSFGLSTVHFLWFHFRPAKIHQAAPISAHRGARHIVRHQASS